MATGLLHGVSKQRLKPHLAAMWIIAERIGFVESTGQIFTGSNLLEYAVDYYVGDLHQCGSLSHRNIEDMREPASKQ